MSRSDIDIRLRFRADRASLARVRAVVESVLREESAFLDEEIRDIVLGLQETLSNVSRHAYGDAGGTIDVTVRLNGHGFDARVRDRGPAFDPTSPPAPDDAAPRESGYGLLLVHRTMDRVTWERRGDQNIVRLERSARPRLKSRPSSAR